MQAVFGYEEYHMGAINIGSATTLGEVIAHAQNIARKYNDYLPAVTVYFVEEDDGQPPPPPAILVDCPQCKRLVEPRLFEPIENSRWATGNKRGPWNFFPQCPACGHDLTAVMQME